MSTLRVALFDLDGTLIDTEGQYSVFWGMIGRRYHPEIPRFEHIIKGSTLTRIFDNYFPDPAVQAEINPQLEAFEDQMQYRFYPGAVQFISDLRAHGVRCAVVTSSNQLKMASVYKQLPELRTLFDRILTSEDFSASKPHPDCYLKGAAAFGADLSECVVFEDAINGLQAGMSSGIYTIGIATGLMPAQIADRCHHVILSYDGLTYDVVNELINSPRTHSGQS